MIRTRFHRIPFSSRSLTLMAAALVVAAGAVGLTWMGGCSPNDPFDPGTLDNHPPRISFFVSSVDTSQELQPTSYSTRTFHWSGTDSDGWVTEYYVAIDTSLIFDAVWDTTISTDTTMTFSPDSEGNADVVFMVVCRDNRGALSDTVKQFIPMQNSPPVVDFQSDFDPLTNLQREFLDADGNVIDSGAAAADTVFWNWGPGNFRFITYDPDGQDTLEPFYRYTLADESPDSTYDHTDPRADPETSWVRVPFFGSEEVKEFTVYLKSVQPGKARTLSVSVQDTVGTGPIYKYSWEVRAPKGPVLYVPDASASRTKNFYKAYLDDRFGPGNWDTYTFWKGFPDDPFTLLESFRKFEMIIWTDTGSASNNIKIASLGGGILDQYLVPNDDSDPGKILLISRILTGTRTGLSNPFRENTLGIKVKAQPEWALNMPPGPQALGLQPDLPGMTSTRGSTDGGVGLQLFDADFPTSEFLYEMESCGEYGTDGKFYSCYCGGLRCLPIDPNDQTPFVAVRSPLRSVDPLAEIVGISLQLDDFDPAEVYPALNAIMQFELGVPGP